MRSNLLSCDVVADYFLLQVDPAAGDTISNLKLQKLVYYAQAWALALEDRPLFGDRIEAWAHGPAVPKLYRRFRKYGSGAIDPYDIVTNPLRDLHQEHRSLLDEVWRKYGGRTAAQLRNLTHNEEPWMKARGDTPPEIACSTEITHDSMRTYYRRTLANDVNSRPAGRAAHLRRRTG